MRKVILILSGIALVCYGLAIPSNAATTAAPASANAIHQIEISKLSTGEIQTKVDGKAVPASPATAQYSIYTGLQFRGNYVCQDNNIGSFYPLESAGDYYEQGGSNVVLAMAGVETPTNCTNYTGAQTIHYSVFNAQQNSPYLCWRLSGSFNAVAVPNYWTGNVQAQVNNAVGECQRDSQLRANTTSEVTGNALGLTAYNDINQFCVMNLVMHFSIAWAQPCDTSRLHWIYPYR